MLDELETLLRDRNIPEARSNLAERIIAASLQEEVIKVGPSLQGVERWLSAFLEGFAIPKPAYAVACALVLGVGLGIFADSFSVLPSMTTDEFALALSVEDVLSTGDFL